jgi:hypothetical protein
VTLSIHVLSRLRISGAVPLLHLCLHGVDRGKYWFSLLCIGVVDALTKNRYLSDVIVVFLSDV